MVYSVASFTAETASSTSATGRGGGGYSANDKIALGCGIGIGLPAAIASIATVWVGFRKPSQIRNLISVD